MEIEKARIYPHYNIRCMFLHKRRSFKHVTEKALTFLSANMLNHDNERRTK